jgi:predicted transcriptional regulator
VQAILKQHKQYSKLVSKMGKMGAIAKPQDSANNMATMQKVMQDPTSKASQAAISKLVNPQMLKQMGGVSGVTKAMQV